ncbi:ABC transporter permease [Microbacterium gorillae]|uniref:ABC transporter permease n=1 Tax=Microbacterium gorillae TaxID=1231063 RepID=UPI000693CD4A|nr:ABC transporter permease [Microbacterium gorillae]
MTYTITDTPTDTVAVTRRPSSLSAFFEKYTLIIITLAVIAFFSFYPGTSAQFLTVVSLNTVLTNMLCALMVALAALFPFVAGYMDFSVGATAAITCVFAARMMDVTVNGFGWPVWLAILVPVALSPLIGIANGFFVTRLKMNPFVTTLGMSLLLYGISMLWTGGQRLSAPSGSIVSTFASTKWLGLPVPVYFVLVIAIVVWYILTHTPFGRTLYGMGSSTPSARLVGIRVDRNLWWSFAIASFLASLAGILQLAQVGSATASDGGSLLFKGITFIFLSATAITPGFFNVWGVVIAGILLSVSVTGLTFMGYAGWTTNVFNGIALLAAVGLSTYLGRRKKQG